MQQDKVDELIKEKILWDDAHNDEDVASTAALWSRLQPRLDTPKARRLWLGYYKAAAVLLVCMGIAAVVMNKQLEERHTTQVARTDTIKNAALPTASKISATTTDNVPTTKVASSLHHRAKAPNDGENDDYGAYADPEQDPATYGLYVQATDNDDQTAY